MLTCKSPRKVMRVAYHLARLCLPAYACKFSRHDFTLPQLFACLVLREQMKLSYRGVEALLADARHWCRDLGMKRVPDHNTLCRAFHAIVAARRIDTMLDVLAGLFRRAKLLGRVLAVDSTLLETHHRSRHYEQRCRHKAADVRAARGAATADARRSRSAKRTPKLSLAVDAKTHLVLAARARLAMGSDAPDFVPLLRGASRRQWIDAALADAGFDSHENHAFARRGLGVRSLIKAGVGRPTAKEPASDYRRAMRRRLAGSQAGRTYGRRAQAETANSMVKRNLGEALRARSARGRRAELLLRVVTHNVMLARCRRSRVETEPDGSHFLSKHPP